MDLLQHFKRHRRIKENQPYQRNTFDLVSALVREYRMTERFLEELDGPGYTWRDYFLVEPLKDKAPFNPPLFSLISPEDYRLTRAIMERVNNPFLNFVHSPEELLPCIPLFREHPHLSPDILGRVHYEILWRYELGHQEVRKLQGLLAAEEEVSPLPEPGPGDLQDKNRHPHLAPRLASLENYLHRLEDHIKNSLR